MLVPPYHACWCYAIICGIQWVYHLPVGLSLIGVDWVRVLTTRLTGPGSLGRPVPGTRVQVAPVRENSMCMQRLAIPGNRGKLQCEFLFNPFSLMFLKKIIDISDLCKFWFHRSYYQFCLISQILYTVVM